MKLNCYDKPLLCCKLSFPHNNNINNNNINNNNNNNNSNNNWNIMDMTMCQSSEYIAVQKPRSIAPSVTMYTQDPLCMMVGFLKIYISYFFQTTWSKNLYFSEFSSQGMIHSYTGKLPKNQIIKQNLAVKSMIFLSYFLRKVDIFFQKIKKNAKKWGKIFFSLSIALLPP